MQGNNNRWRLRHHGHAQYKRQNGRLKERESVQKRKLISQQEHGEADQDDSAANSER
jgi:hypothetical protein